MKKYMLIALFSLTTVLAQAGETVKLLTIGNSFAANSTKYLQQITEAAGNRIVIGKANLGGCSLERHWKHAAAHEADPDDKEGKPYNGRSLQQILESDDWDVITIQQYSWISDDINSYRPYAEDLYELIQKYAPDSRVMMHQTWAYRADDTKKYTGGRTQEDMHDDVRKSYHTIAEELGIGIIPVGEAFAIARNHPDWAFERDPGFDYSNMTKEAGPPANEKHSLCKGWSQWGDQKPRIDTHHAGLLGEYLGGAVFFEVLFGESVVGNSFVPPGADKDDIAFLQEIAHETVADENNTTPNP